VEWHIISGDYPPKPGGVSDYTYRLAQALARADEDVHVWTAAYRDDVPFIKGVEVHLLPSRFGLPWLRALSRGLPENGREGTILVQYVPHMYGWKAMNLAFCFWMALQKKKRKIWVMFHEVAFPFMSGQPLKHSLLAAVHRVMAWIVLRSASKSFTSIDSYRTLLLRLAPPRASVGFMRLFSNVPYNSSLNDPDGCQFEMVKTGPTLGMFSSFGSDICALLDANLPDVLENSSANVLLVGPGANFIQKFTQRFPQFKDRLFTTGRVSALSAGSYIQSCDVLLQLYPDGASGARGTFVAALASGVPVVTTAGPQTEALLISGGAIALAENNPKSIATLIQHLLTDTVRARRIGAAGQRLYENHFDIDIAVATLLGKKPTKTALRRVARSA